MVAARRLVHRARAVLGTAGRLAVNDLRDLPRRLPLRPDTVLFESFAGHGALCHPEAIFRELLASPDLAHLRLVWALDDPARHPEFVAEFRGDPRVRIVRRGSVDYVRTLATAGWLVNNATFPEYFSKRPGQVYLNTWHGTPLKRMGFDEPGGALAARNTLRNFLHADYVVSSGEYMTRQMYEGAYRLANIAPDLRVIDEGEPRTDRQFVTPAQAAQVRDRLRAQGLAVPEDATLVLLAPTWKGPSFAQPVDEAAALAERVRRLQDLLGPGYVVLLKVHQQVHAMAARRSELAGILVSNDLPTNEVLAVTDVLVTDYSSIFFDLLCTDRPILFHTPDHESYLAERGRYLGDDELPGPTTTTLEDLAARIRAIGTGSAQDPLISHGASRDAARHRFAARNDGGATQRIVDIVFRGRREGRRVAPLSRDARPRVLIFLGGLKPNGITASALNLLAQLDITRVDVTAICDIQTEAERLALMARVPHGIRLVIRQSAVHPGKAAWLLRAEAIARGGGARESLLQSTVELVHQEWRHALGGAEFDHLVDFSGYSPFWAFLLAGAPAQSRSIWMHNDLRADRDREIDGKRPFERHLSAVFAAYRYYDHLVSVSPALRDINAERLAAFAPPERFVSARNVLDVDRVLRLAGEPAPEFPRGDFVFVTAGRLSPEKNHERLLRAFAVVHAEQPDTSLVVLGDGPLRARLVDLARTLGVADRVLFTGLVTNPFAVMARCDTFVLSSDYEGQPMVILEARALGLPVVSTAFGSVRSALDDETGLIVERSVDGLAEGLRKALARSVPVRPFDGAAYNAEVLREFEQAVGLRV